MNISAQTSSFHDTQGTIEVNGGGQLQFTLPVALPPGVKSVAPQINLIYTSGSGNGIAGYGWNLSGITAITRMGKTIEKDGETRGIQLDNTDYFAFNGQRLLLKSGTYGANNAEYVTEKYSNLKIKSMGSVTYNGKAAPQYFEVTFEDGSVALYGNAGNSRTPAEYNISQWTDAQGNYITYTYGIINNVAFISTIEWGGNSTAGTPHFNKITFNYSLRQQPENTFVNSVSFVQVLLLNNIVVEANGSQFKKYQITYRQDGTGTNHYQFVEKITEYNADNAAANPVEFTYQTSADGAWINKTSTAEIYESLEGGGTLGDFNGDGKLDILTKKAANKVICYNVFETSGSETTVNMPAGIDKLGNAAITYSNDNGVTQTKQGIAGYTMLDAVSPQDDSGTEWTKTDNILVTVFAVNNNTLTPALNKIAYGMNITSHMEEWNNGRLDYSEHVTTALGKEYVVDLDGDGVNELLVELITIWQAYDHGNEYHSEYVSSYLVVPLNNSENCSVLIGSDIFKSATVGDFDGDGRTEFLTFQTIKTVNQEVSEFASNGKTVNQAYLTKFIKNPTTGKYAQQKTEYGSQIEGFTSTTLVGDFNGDGKADLLMPVGWRSNNTTRPEDFYCYLSTGNGFIRQQFNSLIDITKFNGDKQGYYHSQQVADLDGDGKSEIVSLKTEWYVLDKKYHSKKTLDVKTFFVNAGGISSVQNFYDYTFATAISTTDEAKDGNKLKKYQYSLLTGAFNISNRVNQIVLLADNNGTGTLLKSLSFHHIPTEARIVEIKQSGITTTADYRELKNNSPANFYKPSGKTVTYPYVEFEQLPQSFAVYQLTQTAGGITRKQDFQYRGMTMHLHGRGIIGFERAARSSWYADYNWTETKTWTAVEIDPANDGLPVKEWTVKSSDLTHIIPAAPSAASTRFVSYKEYRYKTFTSPPRTTILDRTGEEPAADKTKTTVESSTLAGITFPIFIEWTAGVKATVVDTVFEKDIANNISSVAKIEYDTYMMPKKTTTNIDNGFAVNVTAMEYFNNPSGTGKKYYIGRPKKKTETVTACGDTQTSQQDFTYDVNNLLIYVKTWNKTGTEWIGEQCSYDTYGNVTQKATSSSDANTAAQVVQDSYDPKGRFVLTKTAVDGQQTHFTYNDWGQVLTQTDPFGVVQTNVYDKWGKLTSSNINISGTTSYTYSRTTAGETAITETHPDNQQITINYDVWGQEVKVMKRAFGGKCISKQTQYDNIGRKTAESEPFLEGAAENSKKWNCIMYADNANSPFTPVTVTDFKGRQVKTTPAAKKTTVTELNGYMRSWTKETDALGNIVKSTDRGRTLTFTYDAAGNVLTQKFGGNTVATTYDSWGRKATFYDPSNGAYAYRYDGFGRNGRPLNVIFGLYCILNYGHN
ncbi:hypothetical protein FACS1894180_3850 [Bacteroidia bacterium]|nr:hypothetical protein FACS1894180_3850 [Bacteroidia bacterium]